jgi:hypothetical protein
MKTLASIMIALLVVTTINGAPQPSPANMIRSFSIALHLLGEYESVL